MGKKSVNPLKGGLSARIYLAAYPKWRTCYEVAKLVFSYTKPRNAAGKVSKEVHTHLEYFDTKREFLSEFKIRTLIRSKHQLFLQLLREQSDFDTEEAKLLEQYLDSGFREAFGVYLDATLKTSRDYLGKDLDAFNELSTLLTFILYLSRLYNKYGSQARTFVLELAKVVMPKLFGSVWENPERQLKPLEVTIQNIGVDKIGSIYGKLKKVVPQEYTPLLNLMERFEQFLDEVPKNSQMRKILMEGFLKAWGMM